MNTNESKKKNAKKSKKRAAATFPQPLASGSRPTGDSNINDVAKSNCPLLAKDSEWVDILRSPRSQASAMTSETDEDEVEVENGPETKPLAIMFPGLLEKDPQTLQGMLSKAMSTTEVTKHLVDLGEKANFTCMKKANRLIPADKQWLGSVAEVNSDLSMEPGVSGSSNNDFHEDTEAKK